jgi:modulator of FtsH protease HflC
MHAKFRVWITALAVTAVGITLCATIVQQSEHAVFTRFGRIVAVAQKPGLHWTFPPPIERTVRIDKRILISRIPQAEFLTADKKNVTAALYLNWRDVAETRLAALAQSALGGALGERLFADIIPSANAPSGLAGLERTLRERMTAAATTNFGIDIVDLGVTQFGFPEQNLASVMARMRAERDRIAKAYRAEGEAEAKKILAEAERASSDAIAAAEGEAARIRGEGDATAARIYADAYRGHESLFAFLKTLETYEQVLNERTTLVLPADAPLLQPMLYPRATAQRP